MIKITHENLDAIARKHYEGLKNFKLDINDILEEIKEKYVHYSDKFEERYKAFSRKEAKYRVYPKIRDVSK